MTRFDHPDTRPPAAVTALDVKKTDALGRSSTAGPEETVEEAWQGQLKAQSFVLSSDSDDVELIKADQKKDSQPEVMADPPLREQNLSTPASASEGASRKSRWIPYSCSANWPEDIGDMIPTCALHSTYFSNVRSIMQQGLCPKVMTLNVGHTLATRSKSFTQEVLPALHSSDQLSYRHKVSSVRPKLLPAG